MKKLGMVVVSTILLTSTLGSVSAFNHNAGMIGSEGETVIDTPVETASEVGKTLNKDFFSSFDSFKAQMKPAFDKIEEKEKAIESEMTKGYVASYRLSLIKNEISDIKKEMQNIEDKSVSNLDIDSYKTEIVSEIKKADKYLNDTYNKEVAAVKKINSYDEKYRPVFEKKYGEVISRLSDEKADKIVKLIDQISLKKEKASNYFSEANLKYIGMLTALKNIIIK